MNAIGQAYEVVAVLGRGGMGTVFRARHRASGADVALKILERGASVGAEFRALRDVDHPNIAHVLDLHVADEGAWFSMEYVPGVPLAEWVGAPNVERETLDLGAAGAQSTHPGARDPARVLDAARQLARALVALHDAGLVHGDIKPGNVRVTPAGRVVLLDFGLARHAGRTTRFATPAYAPPEQLVGQRLTPASDLYALGATLYELAAGRPPFVGGDVPNQKRSAPPPPSLFVPGTPALLDDVVVRLCQPEPNARITAREVLERLDVRRSPRAPTPTKPTATFPHRELARFIAERPGGTALVRGSGAAYALVVQAAPDALILRGRCHDAESVRFRGLGEALEQAPDGVVRELRSTADVVAAFTDVARRTGTRVVLVLEDLDLADDDACNACLALAQAPPLWIVASVAPRSIWPWVADLELFALDASHAAKVEAREDALVRPVPEPHAPLLEALAAAGTALTVPELTQVLGWSPERLESGLDALRSQHHVDAMRSSEARLAYRARCERPDASPTLHRALAAVLQEQQPPLAVRHWVAGGDPRAAVQVALRGAETAARRGDTDEEAALLEAAVALEPTEELRRRAASAWIRAGQSHRAAEHHSALADRSAAAAHLLVAGRRREGMALLEDVLGARGRHPIPTFLRGIGWRLRRIAGPRADDDRGAVWGGATALMTLDPIRSWELVGRLLAGVPRGSVEDGRALALEALSTGALLPRLFRVPSDALAARARRLAPEDALVVTALGCLAFFRGRWRTAHEAFQAARGLPSDPWSRTLAETMRLFSCYHLGAYEAVRADTPRLAEDARARGDLRALAGFAPGLGVAALLGDDPALADEHLARSERSLAEESAPLSWYWIGFARLLVALYRADATAGLHAFELLAERSRGAGVFLMPLTRVQRAGFGMRLALLRGPTARPDVRRWMRSLALHGAFPGARGDIHVGRAMLALWDGDALQTERELRAAEQRYRADEMTGFETSAAVVRELLFSSGGDAQARLRALGVLNPRRFAAMFVPGTEHVSLRRASQSTRTGASG